jgi:hypothetical protein
VTDGQLNVLHFYHSKVVQYIALATIMAGDRFPQEIMNEVRASYTHLAKSTKFKPHDEDYRKEVENAERHLKRVCFDCLKISIMTVAEQIDYTIDSIERLNVLPAAIYDRVEDLRKRRLAFMTNEAQSPSDARIDAYHELFRDYHQLGAELKKDYAGATFEALNRNQRKYLWKNRIISLLIGVAGSALAGLIFAT